MTKEQREALRLAQGAHNSIEDGACIMEAAAWIAGEPWSDHPECVSPVIAEFCRSWNDALPDADRHRLLAPYVAKVLGTKTTKKDEETRAWLATDWLVRVCTPAWLRLAKLDEHARALESLARICDATTARSAQPSLEAARSASAAARDAASAAASAAAWDAAWAAARAAAWDAARDAAWAAARAAARAAAWAALAPTVAALQTSALALLDQMIAVGKKEVPVIAERLAAFEEVAA